ncbi:AraC family transcriptional regulator [Curvivirga aplysinae]|uniref:AraC family transcriptional regulator n=1 Tax=Curvivirga aplysinae TaxID=2529852 RepID=UPI0012BC0E36|nr:AraC family transcriptional regulator [Curvivirga aplysinae]MTI09675.1 AraC family transcriptional regulator [Curvivirga aplysinae]
MSEEKLDRLSALIAQFQIEAHVLTRPDYQQGNFFIIQEKQCEDYNACRLFYYPHKAMEEAIKFPFPEEKMLVAACIDTGGNSNPVTLALPNVVEIYLGDDKALQDVSNILLEEAMASRCGGQAVINRLCEVVMIRLMRHLIEAGKTEVGLLAGLAHPGLSRAIVAMHENPEKELQLEDYAHIAAMSRTHFVNNFRKLVGVTPGQYLSNWRLTLAHMHLKRGMPVKTVASKVGFSGSPAFSRAFVNRFGVSPREFVQNGLSN